MAEQPIGITSLESYAQQWDEAWYPQPVRTFAKLARGYGWDVRIGFSRGSTPGTAEGSWEIRDIIGVWIDGFGRRAGVFWERNPDAQFSARKLDAGVVEGEIPSGAKWSPAGGLITIGRGRAFPYANLTQMTEWTRLQGSVLPGWYADIQEHALAVRQSGRVTAQEKALAGARSLEDAARARIG